MSQKFFQNNRQLILIVFVIIFSFSETGLLYFQFLWVSNMFRYDRRSFILTGCLQLLLCQLYCTIGPECDADTFGLSNRVFHDILWRYYRDTILLHGAIRRLLKIEHNNVIILEPTQNIDATILSYLQYDNKL